MAENKVKPENTLMSIIANGIGNAASEVLSTGGASNSNSTKANSATSATPSLADTLKAKYTDLSNQKPVDNTAEYSEAVKQAMDKIMNRDKFSYDLNGDALYQQYKDQYITQGNLAMQDTIGQASAMTGGYGNSYAQSVGQQAYQGYLQQLNDKVPELYQLALDQYNREGENLLTQYGMLADRENTVYGRYRDKVSDWESELNRGYNEYRDAVGDDQWKISSEEAVRQADREYDLALRQIEEDERNGEISREKAKKEIELAEKEYELKKTSASGSGSGSGSGVKSLTAAEWKEVETEASMYGENTEGLRIFLNGLVNRGYISEAEAGDLWDEYGKSDDQGSSESSVGKISKWWQNLIN